MVVASGEQPSTTWPLAASASEPTPLRYLQSANRTGARCAWHQAGALEPHKYTPDRSVGTGIFIRAPADDRQLVDPLWDRSSTSRSVRAGAGSG